MSHIELKKFIIIGLVCLNVMYTYIVLDMQTNFRSYAQLRFGFSSGPSWANIWVAFYEHSHVKPI